MDEPLIYDNGIHEITNEAYHASAGISRSALMQLNKSPYHYWANYINSEREPQEKTPEFILGNLIHTLVLEPHLADERYVVPPELDRRTKDGKFKYMQFIGTLCGREEVSREHWLIANNVAKAVLRHELAAQLLEGYAIEQSIYFTHSWTGAQCKVRPDARNGSLVVDLKTTADASYRAFQSSAYKYGYFCQAGMIQCALESIGIEMERFVIVSVEKKYPYPVGLFVLDEEAIDFGVNQFNELMSRYNKCRKIWEWPSYPIQTLSIPKYAEYELNQMEFTQ